MRLKQIITISGEIHCLTGLTIGGSSSTLEIGGIDREVIKNPITKEPYIPGSSLKGKMRFELEKKYGAFKWESEKYAKENNCKILETKVERKRDKKIIKVLVADTEAPCGCGKSTCSICKIYGAHKLPNADSAPTRIIVRDALLSKGESNNQTIILERKTENIVTRNSGTADSPRTMERVPEGTKFDFEIILRVFEGDDADSLIGTVKEGLKLVEKSYLGGGGTRGSGQVEFDYEVKAENIEDIK